jgi:hypothetical protein
MRPLDDFISILARLMGRQGGLEGKYRLLM